MQQEAVEGVATDPQAEEQGYALVHWTFDTEAEAWSVFDALRLAAWRATTAGQYAKSIEPTETEDGKWVTGISCEVVR